MTMSLINPCDFQVSDKTGYNTSLCELKVMILWFGLYDFHPSSQLDLVAYSEAYYSGTCDRRHVHAFLLISYWT